METSRRQLIASGIAAAVAVALPPILHVPRGAGKFRPKVTNCQRPRRMGAQVTVTSADGESVLSYWSPMKMEGTSPGTARSSRWELESPPTLVDGDTVSIVWFVAERFAHETEVNDGTLH